MERWIGGGWEGGSVGEWEGEGVGEGGRVRVRVRVRVRDLFCIMRYEG